MNFEKKALNLDEKVELLEKRGLLFKDKEEVKFYLQHIGYFRLTGYFKYFQNIKNIFYKNIFFEQVINLYNFDRKLRFLTLDAIEKIEVSIKANLNDYLSKEFGIFWYLNKELFFLENNKNEKIYKNFLEKINILQKKSSSIFIKEFFKKYDEKKLPSWMLFEELTIGELSNILNILKTNLRQKIADNYGIYQLDFKIWLHLIVNIRNICAHHGRLWNKEYIIKPRLKDIKLGKIYKTNINKDNIKVVISNYHNVALIINYLLKKIDKDSKYLSDLEKLFIEFKNVNILKMGFNKNWKKNFN